MDLNLLGTLAPSRPAVGVSSERVVPYLGGRRSPAWDRIASRTTGVVVRGSSGAAWLREAAHHRGLIDPATYEKRDDSEQLEPRLPFSDDPAADAWLDRQRNASAVGLLAPGVWVPHRDRSVAAEHLERVNHLRDASGDDVVAVLALDSKWLVDGTDEILRVLDGGGPLALILGDANDPLERRGAVQGLVQIIGQLGPQLMVMRCDVGAIGAVAFGARLGSIGTTTGVRHVVPPGKGAGGARGDDSPSLFVPEHLAYRRGSRLEQARDRGLRFLCDCEVCDGAPLDRFTDANWSDEAAEHSWLTVQAAAIAVLDTPIRSGPGAWSHDCAQAVTRIEDDSRRTGIDFGLPGALVQWARLGS